jgi:hypothetical protein
MFANKSRYKLGQQEEKRHHPSTPQDGVAYSGGVLPYHLSAASISSSATLKSTATHHSPQHHAQHNSEGEREVASRLPSMFSSVANRTDPKRLLSKFKRNPNNYTLELSVDEEERRRVEEEAEARERSATVRFEKKKKKSFVDLEQDLFGSSTSSGSASDEDSYWCEIDPSW